MEAVDQSKTSLKGEFRYRTCKHYSISYEEFDRQWEIFSIPNDTNRPEQELKKHFFNWLKQQELKRVKTAYKTFDDMPKQ
mgnify:FL=1